MSTERKYIKITNDLLQKIKGALVVSKHLELASQLRMQELNQEDVTLLAPIQQTETTEEMNAETLAKSYVQDKYPHFVQSSKDYAIADFKAGYEAGFKAGNTTWGEGYTITEQQNKVITGIHNYLLGGKYNGTLSELKEAFPEAEVFTPAPTYSPGDRFKLYDGHEYRIISAGTNTLALLVEDGNSLCYNGRTLKVNDENKITESELLDLFKFPDMEGLTRIE